MKKKLGWISRSDLEDICAFVLDIQGIPHVELRIYRRSPVPGGRSMPVQEGLVVPVSIFPDLLRLLEQSQTRLVQQGLVSRPYEAAATTMEAGDPVPLGVVLPPSSRRDARRDPRVLLTAPVGCRLLESEHAQPFKPLIGEIKDISKGGAQLWLPTRLSLFSCVEIFMEVEGLNFRGRAEVVGAEIHPQAGRYRHGLRWLDLNSEAKTALAKLLPAV